MTDRIPTAPVAAWLDPSEHPPPEGTKMLLLTEGGIAILGHWGYGCVAWSPLPQIPLHIKKKLIKEKL